MLSAFLSSFLAFGITIFAINMLQPLALKLGLIDSPGGRKQHTGNIPLIGGIAMFLSFAFTLLTLPISLENYRSLIAASALLVWLGVLDDFSELSPASRLIGQCMAAVLITAWGGQMVYAVGNLFGLGILELHNWSMPFTIIAIMGVINAVNMSDGVDGLTATLALIQFGLLLALAHWGGRLADVQMLLVQLGALLGFWIYNFSFPRREQALIFMGDAGSMFLGISLVWFLISLSQGTQAAARPVTMLWIIALPLLDAANVMLQRISQRRSPLTPDRRHIHHLLHARGWSKPRIVLSLAFFTLTAGIIGILSERQHIPDTVMFSCFLGLFAVYVAITNRLWKNSASMKGAL